jgi:hypothetical protein
VEEKSAMIKNDKMIKYPLTYKIVFLNVGHNKNKFVSVYQVRPVLRSVCNEKS